MNADKLQNLIVTALNEALNSGQTAPGAAIAILECAKLDVHAQMRAQLARKPLIQPISVFKP